MLIRSLPLSIQTFPLRPVTRGAVFSTAAAVAATRTPIVIGGNDAPGASTSLRVQVTVVVPVHVHPVPLAPVDVKPAGMACVTVVVDPSVAPSVGLETVRTIEPVSPRTNTDGVCAAAILSGCGTSAHGAGGVPA